jgi:hypothetical protein
MRPIPRYRPFSAEPAAAVAGLQAGIGQSRLAETPRLARRPTASRAFNAQHVELALDIAEYEIGPGHGGNPRGPLYPICGGLSSRLRHS